MLTQKADSAPRVEQRSIPKIQQHIRNCRVNFCHISAIRYKAEKKNEPSEFHICLPPTYNGVKHGAKWSPSTPYSLQSHQRHLKANI